MPLRAILIWIVATLPLLVAPTVLRAATPSASVSGAWPSSSSELAAVRDALADAVAGKPRATPLLRELVGVDPADEAASAARLAALRAGSAAEADAGAVDAAVALEHEVVALSIRFLELPQAERLARVEAQAQLAREEKAKADRAIALEEADRKLASAKQAQAEAAAAATNAGTLAERAIAEVRAKLESVRVAQAKLRHDLANEHQDLLTESRAHADRLQELSAASFGVQTGSAAADALYDQIAAEVEPARLTLERRLDAWVAKRAVPTFDGDVGALAIADPDARARLEALAKETNGAAAELAKELGDARWDALRRAVEWERALGNLRLGLIDRVSGAKRDRVLGLGRDGLDELHRELLHARAIARWGRVAGTRVLIESLRALRSPAEASLLVTKGVFFVAMVWVAARLRRGSARWLARLREALGRGVRPPWSRLLQRLVDVVDAVRDELVVLAFALLVPVLTGIGRGPLTAGLWNVFVLYALYRLAIAGAHRFLARVTATGNAVIDERRAERAEASARFAGRYVLAVALLSALLALALGEGALHRLFVRAAWLGGAAVAVLLLRRWQHEIADGYVALRPNGAFSDLVRATRDRWHGFFVAIVAFAVLVTMRVGRLARSFVLGFDQSRRALAYLFRRRLEKHTEAEEAAVDPESLPRPLREALSELPVHDESLLVDRFPELDAFDDALARFRSRGDVGAVLVVGRTGFGKTTWIDKALARASDLPVARVELSRRDSTAGFFARIAEAVSAPPAAHEDVASLCDHLRSTPWRVVAIDDLHVAFSRTPGGFEAWARFMELVEHTAGHVFWVASCAHYAFEYLTWVRGGAEAFRLVVQLPPWSEQEIEELLRARTKAAGFKVSYDDILTEKLDGKERAAQVRMAAGDYNRLVWDHAEGSPRAALHAWGRSLATDPDDPRTLRVHLFRGFRGEVFEALSEHDKLVLAGLVWHERANVNVLSRSLRLPPRTCETALEKLRERGALHRVDDDYVLTTSAWATAIRYLRRRHFVTT